MSTMTAVFMYVTVLGLICFNSDVDTCFLIGSVVPPCSIGGRCPSAGKSKHAHYHCMCGAVIQRFERMVKHSLNHQKQSLRFEQAGKSSRLTVVKLVYFMFDVVRREFA